VKESKETLAVVNCFKKHHENYGRIRIHHEMKRQGKIISEVKIAAILKRNHLFAKCGRHKKHRTLKSKAEYLSENLVVDKFEVTKRNVLWCSDITEVKYKSGKLYICAIIDVGTRKIVGWDVQRNQCQNIAQQSLQMAAFLYKPAPGLIYHTDRGCQFTALKTKSFVDKHGLKSSMSRPGKPCDNQPIESFWKTLKQEITDLTKLNYEQAKREIVKYLQLYYNAERLHSSIGYNTPNEVWELQENCA
jgi:transposase InsO family protein